MGAKGKAASPPREHPKEDTDMRIVPMKMVPRTMGLALGIAASLVQAASHREAPLIALDPAADITDVYAFVSYDAANVARQPADRRVTLKIGRAACRER